MYNNNTALIKKNAPILYCLSHDKDVKFKFKINTIKECFTPILLGLKEHVSLLCYLTYSLLFDIADDKLSYLNG